MQSNVKSTQKANQQKLNCTYMYVLSVTCHGIIVGSHYTIPQVQILNHRKPNYNSDCYKVEYQSM